MKIFIIIFIAFLNEIFGLSLNYINYKEENDVAILSLNHKKDYNIITSDFLKEFEKVIDSININKVYALIIMNDEYREIFYDSKCDTNLKYNLPKNEIEELYKKRKNILRKLENLPILVIGIINGNSYGFELDLFLSCDIRICSKKSVFSFQEVKESMIPGFLRAQRLTEIIGSGMAKQLIFTGQSINSEEAFKIKLVNSIYPQNELLNEAKKYILKTNHLLNKGNNNFTIFHIRIKYETKLDEKIYIYGNNTDFGNWKLPKYKLHWSSGNIWQGDYAMLKNDNCIKYKFVCHSNSYDKWEEGDNRLLCPKNLNGLPRSNDGKYILDFIWNHFKLNFNIHYNPPNEDSYMQIAGSPSALTNWQKDNSNPLKMELYPNKELIAKDGNIIKGFWTLTAIMRTSDIRNFNFEYRYSLYDKSKRTAMWEREPNRHIYIFTDENEFYKYLNNDKHKSMSLDSYYLLTNSFLEILDVNFVSDFVFNKIGDKNIFIGPYPQSKNDFKKLNDNGINVILNVQTDKDMKIRQINHQFQIEEAKKYDITIDRYPIEDFNQIDLYNKLKGAGDLLNKLIKEKKKVYVHCTAGMSRAAATVIMYLVLYENYTVKEADNYCKKYRPIICPNYGVINKIASEYKPGSEMEGVAMYNFEP